MEAIKNFLNDKLKPAFEKLGTILVDRRFWAANVAVTVVGVASYFIVDVQGLEEVLEAGFDVYDSVTVVVVAFTDLITKLAVFIAVVTPYIALIVSWTKRVPSGLGFKALVDKEE